MDDIEEIPINTNTMNIKHSSRRTKPKPRTEFAVHAETANWLHCPPAGITPLQNRPYKYAQMKNCSRANMVTAANGEQYLVLPDQETWDDNTNDHYNSDAMFIRKSYAEIARRIIEHAEISTSRRTRMTLSGASDTGKSFFLKYFVWLLLHTPSGVSVPDIILWKHSQGGVKGDLYCFGSLYSVINVPQFVVTDICEDLMYKRDAWIIYDGEPPRDPPI
jgi:hypothetical protein